MDRSEIEASFSDNVCWKPFLRAVVRNSQTCTQCVRKPKLHWET